MSATSPGACPNPRAHAPAWPGRPLRLLIAGDSAAAGVGADRQEEALAGRLVAALAPRVEVRWRLEAKTGYTTAQAHGPLLALPEDAFDVVVMSLGINDVTGGVGLKRWLAQQAELVALLRARFRARQVLLSALPSMHLFPALPQPLRWYLGAQAGRFNHRLAAWAATREDCRFVPADFVPDVGAMASDGFHPGPPAYAQWAAQLARQIEASHDG